MTQDRPANIRHWREIEPAEQYVYSRHHEKMAFDAPLSRHFGLSRLGLHHVRLPPGTRTSFPHSESLEEELIFVIEGTPEVWIDGTLHALVPGDTVGFAAGTGVAHSFLNNSASEVRLIVLGEPSRAENRTHYPLNRERREFIDYWWDEAPERPLGDHDGLPDAVRAAKPPHA